MRRTDTTSRTKFERSGPEAAIFDFFETNTIRITIPKESKFSVRVHWHYTLLDTSRLSWVSGGKLVIDRGHRDSWRTSSRSGGYQGFSEDFSLDQAVAWGPLYQPGRDQLPLVVDIQVLDVTLQRNICSAIHDRDIFFQLATTPWWVKGIYAILTKRLREQALDFILKIQLQAMYWAHDYHVFHGEVPLDWTPPLPITDPWGQPPRTDKAYRSRFWVSKMVMRSYYWAGRLLLGMKGEYEQYTPSRSVVEG